MNPKLHIHTWRRVGAVGGGDEELDIIAEDDLEPSHYGDHLQYTVHLNDSTWLEIRCYELGRLPGDEFVNWDPHANDVFDETDRYILTIMYWNEQRSDNPMPSHLTHDKVEEDLQRLMETGKKEYLFLRWCIEDTLSTTGKYPNVEEFWAYYHAAHVHTQNGPLT
jgi:hypothetical protein